MKQNALSKWLRLIIVGVGVCAVIIYAAVVPMLANAIVDSYPEFSGRRLPWLILVWATAIPCFIALIFAWKIAVNIGANRSFSAENARFLKWIAVLAAADAAVFLIGNIVYFLLNMSHPSVALFSLLIEFFAAAISVASAALSHLVLKAAELQEQSDLTI